MVSHFKALCVGVAVETGLRLVPVGRLSRWLGIRTAKGSGSLARPVQGDDVIRATDRVLTFWPRRGLCLRRSLVLGALLRRYEPVLRIGVRRESGRIRAHAWIEIDGVPIGERGHEQFHALS